MQNKYWVPLFIGIAVLIAVGATWYAVDKNNRENAARMTPQKTRVSQEKKQEVRSNTGVVNQEQGIVSENTADTNEAIIEKSQPVSPDTSLDAIDKELNQTNVSME